MEHEDDIVLKFEKKTKKTKKNKKTKEKSIDEILKERQDKKLAEESIKIQEELTNKKNQKKKISELKDNEKSGVDFELNILNDDYGSLNLGEITGNSSENSSLNVDSNANDSEFDFM